MKLQDFTNSIIQPIQQKTGDLMNDFTNSAMGQAAQGKWGNVIPAIGNELGSIASGKTPISFGGEMETIPTIPASMEGIQMPQYGLPKEDISDLESSMDSIQNNPRSSGAKEGFNTLQDIVERYAPSHANDTNNQLLNTASRILDAHYGNGSATLIEPLGHNH